MFNMQTWADEFFKQPTKPMSKKMSEIFVQMVLMDVKEQEQLNIPEIQSQFLYQIIDKRAEHIGLKLSDPAKIFLMFETKSPGTAVMYLYALRSKFTEANTKTLSDLFPMGFPQDDTLEQMWEKQKNSFNGANYLDSYFFVDTKKQNKP